MKQTFICALWQINITRYRLNHFSLQTETPSRDLICLVHHTRRSKAHPGGRRQNSTLVMSRDKRRIVATKQRQPTQSAVERFIFPKYSKNPAHVVHSNVSEKSGFLHYTVMYNIIKECFCGFEITRDA